RDGRRDSPHGSSGGDTHCPRIGRSRDHQGMRALLSDGRDPVGADARAPGPPRDDGQSGQIRQGSSGRPRQRARADRARGGRLTLERLWLRATARAEREALGRTIQYTPPEAWDQDSVSAGWRNRDIVAHLAASEVGAAAAMAGETSAEVEEFIKGLEGK